VVYEPGNWILIIAKAARRDWRSDTSRL